MFNQHHHKILDPRVAPGWPPGAGGWAVPGSLAGVRNPYKTLLKAAFGEGPDRGAQILIKPVVYEGFYCTFSEKVMTIIGKAIRL